MCTPITILWAPLPEIIWNLNLTDVPIALSFKTGLLIDTAVQYCLKEVDMVLFYVLNNTCTIIKETKKSCKQQYSRRLLKLAIFSLWGTRTHGRQTSYSPNIINRLITQKKMFLLFRLEPGKEMASSIAEISGVLHSLMPKYKHSL